MAKEKNKVKIIPVSGSQNMLLLEKLPDEEKRPSGLLLLDAAVKPQYKGLVISVTPVDCNGKKPTVKEGDTVVYSKFAGNSSDLGDGKDYGFLREFDILAIIK
jgi:chaperonin GroES